MKWINNYKKKKLYIKIKSIEKKVQNKNLRKYPPTKITTTMKLSRNELYVCLENKYENKKIYI